MRRTAVAMVAGWLGVLSAPAAAQLPQGRVSVEPYVAYGFFGKLPDNGPELEADVAFGGRAAFQLSERLALFGSYQRATPSLTDGRGEAAASHGGTGVELPYRPRGGAEGMLPILLEAGIGQARYDSEFGFGPAADWALNLGVASALPLAERVSLRFGANDYLSTGGDDFANQIFVRVGAEFRF